MNPFDDMQLHIKRPPTTGDPKADAMIEANIAMAEQLAVLNILLYKISERAEGNSELTEVIKSKIEELDAIAKNSASILAAADVNHPGAMKQFKEDLIKKIDETADKTTKSIAIILAAISSLFGFIVFVIEKLYGPNISQAQLQQLAIDIAKLITK